jgi:DNA-binding LytR/AlgR family response regulator
VYHGACLEGRRVLVAEDEFLLALELEAVLQRRGCVVLGPVATVEAALAVVDRRSPDGAVLDVNLRGRRATPVAARLRARSVPFVLVTGYGERQLDEPELRGPIHLDKPVNGERLLRSLARALKGA